MFLGIDKLVGGEDALITGGLQLRPNRNLTFGETFHTKLHKFLEENTK